jgi:hypothetical protein
MPGDFSTDNGGVVDTENDVNQPASIEITKSEESSAADSENAEPGNNAFVTAETPQENVLTNAATADSSESTHSESDTVSVNAEESKDSTNFESSTAENSGENHEDKTA